MFGGAGSVNFGLSLSLVLRTGVHLVLDLEIGYRFGFKDRATAGFRFRNVYAVGGKPDFFRIDFHVGGAGLIGFGLGLVG